MAEILIASESVTEGHPDKVCDYIADSILDAYLEADRGDNALGRSRVAAEVMCKGNLVVLAGEISSRAPLDHAAIVRRAVADTGWTDPAEPFHADGITLVEAISKQSPEIAGGVDVDPTTDKQLGAGDQGLMFGYATDETPELMPLPILLAHRLTQGLADDRKSRRVEWLRPDGKSQVTLAYAAGAPARVVQLVVVAQHAPDVGPDTVTQYVREELGPRVLGDWWSPDIELIVNPTGSFVHGGPSVDSGLTGRKIIVDTYGGAARHGGGAFSGKDPTKVDRTAAYWCRYVARRVVEAELAGRAEVRVAYAIGRSEELFTGVETFGTGDEEAALEFVNQFDFSPRAIIDALGLLTDVEFKKTANYGHFGRPGFPWETD